MQPQQESLKRKSSSPSISPSKRPVLNSPNRDALYFAEPTEIRNGAFADIQDTFDQGDYDQVIRQSNILIDDLNGLLAETIKLRMKAWSNKGNYTEQLMHAEELIQIVPKDPEGYVNACHIFSTRGQQKKVLETTMAGINEFKYILERSLKFSDTVDIGTWRITLYKLLFHAEEAMSRLENRVDFVDRLPYDLACKVADHLPKNSLLECSQVSHSWRDLLLHYPAIWRTYYIEPTYDASSIPLFPSVTSYIEDLSYCSDESNLEAPEIFDRFLLVVGSANFSRLQQLTIFTDFRLTRTPESISTIFANVSAKITDLCIISQGEQAIPLIQVLMNFKNLTTLRYRCHSSSGMEYFTVPTLPHMTLLQNIEIEVEDSSVYIQSEQLDNLFRNSPHLRAIGLFNVDLNVLTTIRQHCPKVAVLNIDDSEVNEFKIAKQISVEATGLRSLFVYFGSSVQHLRRLMEVHRDTLREISIRSLYLDKVDPPLLTSRLPHVEKLVIDAGQQPLAEHQAVSLLRHCSFIRSLILNGGVTKGLTITNNIAQTLGSLRHLEEIDIEHVNTIADESIAISAFQGLKALKKVNLSCCFGQTHVLFNAIAHAPSLKNLSIYCGKIIYRREETQLAVDHLRDFTSRLSMLNHLREIKFSDMTLSVEALREFQNNHSLKSIELRDINGISKEQACNVIPSHIAVKYDKY